MNERNKAAKRLRRFLGQERPEELHDLGLNNLLDEALAAERRTFAKEILEEMYVFPGEHFNFLMQRLHEAAD